MSLIGINLVAAFLTLVTPETIVTTTNVPARARPDQVVRLVLASRQISDVRFTDGRRVTPEQGFSEAGCFEIACTIDGKPFRGGVTCNVSNQSDRGRAELRTTFTRDEVVESIAIASEPE